MIRFRFSVVLFLVCSGFAAAQATFFPYKTHVETLPNGLKVIMVPMNSPGLLAYWTIVRTGARDEYEPGHTGFAHFFEHMMFRGTEKFSADEYSAITTEMGASANAFTSDDLTGYHLAITLGDLEKVIEIESDRFQNLKYPKSDFQTEAGAVYGEYRKNRTSPFFTIYEALYKKAFDKHTYGHTAMGYEEDIKRMPEMYDYSLTFFDRYYRPENAILLIAGDIQPDSTLELVKKYYGGWEPGYKAPTIPEEPPQAAEKRLEVAYEGKSLPIVWLGYKWGAFDPSDKTYAAAAVLAALAFGETSDIYKKLVLDEQVVQMIEAEATPNRDPGLLHIYSMVKSVDKIDYVIAEIDKTIARYREGPPDAERLAGLKSRLKYSFLMNLDTPSNVAESLAPYIALTGGIESVDALYKTYDAVTPEDVQAAANLYLDPARRTVGILKGTE